MDRLTAADEGTRVQALGRVLHLVADLHQPLHCCTRDDRGGNAVQVAGLPRAMNLHELWDNVYAWDEVDGRVVALDSRGSSHQAFAETLARSLETAPPSAAEAAIDPRAWVEASWRLACEVSYAGLRDLPPEAGHQRVELEAGYLHRAHETSLAQLNLAGARLAAVLRQGFAPRESAPRAKPAAKERPWAGYVLGGLLAAIAALLLIGRRQARRG
jgi:hypothetical protein